MSTQKAHKVKAVVVECWQQ